MPATLRDLVARRLYTTLIALTPVIAQAEATPPVEVTPAASESEPDAAPPEAPAVESSDVSAESIALLREQAASAESLSEEARAEIDELAGKAAARLAETQKNAATTAALKLELERRDADLAKLQQSTADVPSEVSLDGLGCDALDSRLTVLGQEVGTAKDQSQKIAAEIERRAQRRQAIPGLLKANAEQSEKLAASLNHPLESDSPLSAQARRLYHQARKKHLAAQRQLLEQENLTYEATARLWLARRDAAEKQLQALTNQLEAVQQRVAEARRIEAASQAKAARIAAINAHPAIKSAAAVNADLAARNEQLVDRLHQLDDRLTKTEELAQTMKGRLVDVTKRADAAQQSTAIGAMLRSQQDRLPPLRPFRERLRTRPVEASQLGLDKYQWEALRRESLDVEQIAADVAATMATDAQDLSEAAKTELRRVLDTRTEILAEAINNANNCLSRMEKLDAAESEVVSTTEELAAFIAEQILWVRSAPTLGSAELQYARAFWSDWESRSQQARQVAAALAGDASRRPLLWSLGALLACVLVVGRARARRVLRDAGAAAAKPTATQFRLTVHATAATFFLAIPVPTIVGFLGWRLSGVSNSQAVATGWALMLFAGAYAMLNLVKHATRPGGLGANHFNWNKSGLAAIRRGARLLELLALPLLVIAVGVDLANDEPSIHALGRLSLMGALAVIGAICYGLFRRRGKLGQAVAAGADALWSLRWLKVLAPLVMVIVIGLAAASAAGYHYTAMQLTRRAITSCLFLFACLALRSLLMRWLLVAYRRAAMQQAREKRQAMLEAQENAASDAPPIDLEPQVCLSDINQQARRLVGVGVGLAFGISMWLVWNDVLPALTIFNRVELWASSLSSADPDAGIAFVTLGDLILAAGLLVLTWFAGRNLPGLLEIAVFQKLPLDAGARYAASSITRYVIMVAGAALFMRQLGIGWQSVQWLVAAMTVGLGFGLQEIFANFVAGIILLFERPARVGDTVTVGTITGTVTKIRIRATTILDWDNKELIVPNKDFVTGNLVNWTLSNPNLRLIIRVGIAYGSDTRLATRLLYEVAENNPNVLRTPEPVVIFNEFGDSTLNFELRVFVDDLVMYRRLKHDLHLEIDDQFRENHIEIAFPQCDLHLKTFPPAAETVFSPQEVVEPGSAAA